MSEKRNVTAWVLDDTVTVAAEGATLAGIPGIWHQERPVSPLAFGISVSEFGKLVDDLSLPLKRVSVKESDAVMSFDGLRHNHLQSADAFFGTEPTQGEREALAAGGLGTVEATQREAHRIEQTTQDEAAAGVVVVPVEEES